MQRSKEELAAMFAAYQDILLPEDVLVEFGDNDWIIVTDATRAFGRDGGLPVQGAEETVPVIKRLLRLCPLCRRLCATDTHPCGHSRNIESYLDRKAGFLTLAEIEADLAPRLAPCAQFTLSALADEVRTLPDQRIMVWPTHGCFGTFETQLLDGLEPNDFALNILKGMNPLRDSYSCMYDESGHSTGATALLRGAGAKRLFNAGLALDFCVGSSAEDQARDGFESYVVLDATRTIDLPNTNADMAARLKAAGVRALWSWQIVGHADF